MEAATHIIGRQDITVSYHGKTDAFALQREINAIFIDRLPARLSEILDRFSRNGQTIRLDKVQINARIDSKKDLGEAIFAQIEEQLEKQLFESIRGRPGADANNDIGGSFAATLAFYLNHGYLPWWSTIVTAEAWKDSFAGFINESKAVVLQTVTPLLKNPDAITRLAALLNEQEIINLLELTEAEIVIILKNIATAARMAGMQKAAIDQFTKQALLSMLSTSDDDIYTRFVLGFLPVLQTKVDLGKTAIFVEHIESKELKTAFARMAERAVPAVAKDYQINTKDQPTAGEAILTNTAGLVLVAPYLTTFFNHIGLVADQKITDPQRAVTLLHYIATGNETFEEFELSLEKTLTCLAVNEVLLPGYIITTEEKEHVYEMLTAVIAHWETLKSTSVAGLQSAFLMREGRLGQKNDQWRLVVQRQAHDMLLDYIPWNFKLIKLPWMDQLLTVEWN